MYTNVQCTESSEELIYEKPKPYIELVKISACLQSQIHYNVLCFMHGASPYNMSINQQDAQISCDQTLFFHQMLYMFRTILVHHQEQLYKLYIAFGTCRYMPTQYVWLFCGYNHTTATRIVPTYAKCDVQLIKVAPDDGLIQSETCRASNGKIKSNHKKFVHCTV